MTSSSEARTPLVLPRPLIFFSSLWMIGSWVVAIGFRPPIQPSSASYTPGVRLMLLCLAVGLMIGWPLFRLSQQTSPYPIRQTWLDIIVLLTMVQVVIWPLRLVTDWSVPRMAAMDATLAGWMTLAGAVIAAAVGSDRGGVRTLAMLACVCMCLLGPAAAWLGVATGVNALELIALGPFMAMRTLGEGGGAPPSPDQWRWITLLFVAGAAMWLALFAWTLWLRSSRRLSL